MTADLSNLVVEILHNRGDDNHPDWSVGSGFFVGTNLVLTAFHNVDGQGELLVRVHGKEEHSARVSLQGDKNIDLAVLEVSDVAVDVPLLSCGEVVRGLPAMVERCWAVGFPKFKVLEHERGKPKPPPSSAQVNGEIPTGDYLGLQLLTLQVRKSPRPHPQGSEWEGMSGAVVFSGDYIIVGVITEHHLPEGESALTVVPITAIDLLPEATKWWELLGVDRQELVLLPIQSMLNSARQSKRTPVTSPANDVQLIPPAQGLEGLRAVAKFTDQIWPVPVGSSRDLGEAQDDVQYRDLGEAQVDIQYRYPLGSRLKLAIASDQEGYLLLLDEGPTGNIFCLCPSWFAPDTHLHSGLSYLPQENSSHDGFPLTGEVGRERLLAIISDQPLGLHWMTTDARRHPARKLNQADVDSLLARLRELGGEHWAALSTYFEVISGE